MLLSKNQIYEDIMAGKIRIINAWSIKHSVHPDNQTLNLPIYSIINDLMTKRIDDCYPIGDSSRSRRAKNRKSSIH